MSWAGTSASKLFGYGNDPYSEARGDLRHLSNTTDGNPQWRAGAISAPAHDKDV